MLSLETAAIDLHLIGTSWLIAVLRHIFWLNCLLKITNIYLEVIDLYVDTVFCSIYSENSELKANDIETEEN